MTSYTLFEDEDGRTFWWRDCEVPGCPNQVCLGRSDRFCWPHGPGDKSVGQMIQEAKAKEETRQ